MEAGNPGGTVGFAPRRIGHATLLVRDLERSMGFYHKMCGLQEVFREPSIGAGYLSNGRVHHDVALVQVAKQALIGRDGHVQVRAGEAERPGLLHLGFEMESEVELVSLYQRARSLGLKIRATDHQICRSVYLYDPEDNLLEFYVDATKDWRAVFRAAENQRISGPWSPGERAPSHERNYPTNPEIKRVEGALFHSVGMNHAVLAVSDLENSLRFYTEFLGFLTETADQDSTFAVVHGVRSRGDLALFRVRSDQPAGLHHIGLEIRDEQEFDHADTLLENAGVRVETRLNHATKRSIFVRDPDGILVEFSAERSAPFEPLGCGYSQYFASSSVGSH